MVKETMEIEEMCGLAVPPMDQEYLELWDAWDQGIDIHNLFLEFNDNGEEISETGKPVEEVVATVSKTVNKQVPEVIVIEDDEEEKDDDVDMMALLDELLNAPDDDQEINIEDDDDELSAAAAKALCSKDDDDDDDSSKLNLKKRKVTDSDGQAAAKKSKTERAVSKGKQVRKKEVSCQKSLFQGSKGSSRNVSPQRSLKRVVPDRPKNAVDISENTPRRESSLETASKTKDANCNEVMKLENARKRLHKSYEESNKAKKSRSIQLVDFRSLPKFDFPPKTGAYHRKVKATNNKLNFLKMDRPQKVCQY